MPDTFAGLVLADPTGTHFLPFARPDEVFG